MQAGSELSGGLGGNSRVGECEIQILLELYKHWNTISDTNWISRMVILAKRTSS
jgi:hypothetical protein